MSISTLPAVIDKAANNNEPIDINDEEDFVDDNFEEEDDAPLADATDVLYFEDGIPSSMGGKYGRLCSLREIYELLLQDHSHELVHSCFKPTCPIYNYYTEAYVYQEMLVGIHFYHPEWTRGDCEILRSVLFTILGDRCRLAYVGPNGNGVYIVVPCVMDWGSLPDPPHTEASVNFHAFDLMEDVLSEIDAFFRSACSEDKMEWLNYRREHGKLAELKDQLIPLYELANLVGKAWKKRHYMAVKDLPICFDEDAEYRE
jgi:hypothetical protein